MTKQYKHKNQGHDSRSKRRVTSALPDTFYAAPAGSHKPWSAHGTCHTALYSSLLASLQHRVERCVSTLGGTQAVMLQWIFAQRWIAARAACKCSSCTFLLLGASYESMILEVLYTWRRHAKINDFAQHNVLGGANGSDTIRVTSACSKRLVQRLANSPRYSPHTPLWTNFLRRNVSNAVSSSWTGHASSKRAIFGPRQDISVL